MSESAAKMKDHDFAKTFSKVMSNEEYHQATALSSSGLRVLTSKSPAHFLEYRQKPQPPTPAMEFGQYVHDAILQPELFNSKYRVLPELDRRTKAGKDAYSGYLEENADPSLIHLTENQSTQIQGMMKAVYSHKSASKALQGSHNEQSFFWHDYEYGIDCKCRPDALREGHIIVDLKTTDDASLKGFQSSIARFGYHQQAAFYLKGLSEVTAFHYDTFVIVAVEKKPPYAVAVYVLDEATLELGAERNKIGMKLYAGCVKTDKWPAYSDDVQPIAVPSYAWNVYE